jgi:hypothetical protein
MSARLSMAIRIGDAAMAIVNKTRTFPAEGFGEDANSTDYQHIGVEPMLLALAMELALKAWFVFDYDDPHLPKTHDLSKLFDRLDPQSQERLDEEFKRRVAPFHPSGFFADYGIRHLLLQHKDAFVDWRYLHEPKNTSFQRVAFEATLVMVIEEFRKRYRIEPALPRWP